MGFFFKKRGCFCVKRMLDGLLCMLRVVIDGEFIGCQYYRNIVYINWPRGPLCTLKTLHSVLICTCKQVKPTSSKFIP